jgi:hypothetical protein
MTTPTEPKAQKELFDKALLTLIERKGAASLTDLFILKEAVSSTLLEHPELVDGVNDDDTD